MSGNYDCRLLDETDYPIWNQFVSGSSCGSIYSNTSYLSTLSAATGGQFQVLAVWKGSELQAGIALYTEHRNGLRLTGNRLLLYYHPIVLRDFANRYPSEQTSRQLAALGALSDALLAWKADQLTIHSRHPLTDLRPFLKGGWGCRPSYSYLLEFADIKEAYNRIDQNQRRLIDRAIAEGATLSDDTDFDSFYRLHLQTHERKGAPLYLPKEAFRRYVTQLTEAKLGRLFHARLSDGRAVASQLVLHDAHPVTHTVCAAADKEYLRLGTTPFLRWKTCELLAAEGYRATDLTDASLSDVTRFKSQLGARLVTNSVISLPDSTRYSIRKKLGSVLSTIKKRLGR